MHHPPLWEYLLSLPFFVIGGVGVAEIMRVIEPVANARDQARRRLFTFIVIGIFFSLLVGKSLVFYGDAGRDGPWFPLWAAAMALGVGIGSWPSRRQEGPPPSP